MYTRVKDIIRLDRGPGSSLGDTLLAASLNVLTIDQPSAELMTPVVACEPTLDDVDIASVQRGDQSRGVVIPRPSSPGGAAGGHDRGGGPPAGRGGIPVGNGPVCSRSGAPAGGRGGTTGDSIASAPDTGK
jgi:hypothetical protein